MVKLDVLSDVLRCLTLRPECQRASCSLAGAIGHSTSLQIPSSPINPRRTRVPSDLAVRITDLNGESLAGSNYPRAPSPVRRKFIASRRAL